uniref:AC5 n=1 Tax=Sida mosaic Bolivia virus 2 TaxID=932070 RepID=A0A075MG59_9GEMI|nr:AC5 [Sida mosaic Bolivia virus 2]
MVVDHIVVDLPKTLDQSLLVASILTAGNLGIKPVHHLITIAKIVLHSSGTGLVVKHVEHLAKIHWSAIRSTIPDQPEHHTVRVVLQLDILVHPYLT